VATLWTADGAALASTAFPASDLTGWQQVSLPGPFHVRAGTTYVASYHTEVGYVVTLGYYVGVRPRVGLVTLPVDHPEEVGVFSYADPPEVPDRSFRGTNYWVDVVFRPDVRATRTQRGG
jgi:hypothetical protein